MSGTERDDDLRALAGEYVLGVLDADEMRAVRLRARAEPALAAEIAGWEGQLLPLTGAVAPVQPPAGLWQRIEAQIAPVLDEPANDAAPFIAASAPAAFAPRAAVRSRALRGWQASTAVAMALAAGFAVLAFLPNLGPPPPPPRFAAIAPMGAPTPAFLAASQPDGTVVLTALSPAAVPSGRDLELWILPPGAQKVASLGVLPVSGKSVRLAAMPATGTQLLVSLEPTGGSPTGQPTGPVLYAGTLASL